MASVVDLDSWRRMRSQAMYCYYIGSLFGGMLETIFYSTEYLYIRDTIRPSNPTLYFGIGSASQHLSGMVTAFIGSMYYDCTRHVRRLKIFTSVCIVVGSVFYVLPYSVWLVITGNFLYGFICIANSAVIAELVHVHPADQVTKIIATVSTLFALGLVLGPALAYAFVLVNVKVNSWTLTFGNTPAVVMGGVYLFYIVFVWFLVHDLTLIYDLKEDSEQSRMLLFRSESSSDEEGSEYKAALKKQAKAMESKMVFSQWMLAYLRLSKKVLIERHFAILLFTTAVATFSHFLYLGLIVVKAKELLNWDAMGVANLRIIMACGVICGSVVIQTCSRCLHDFYILLSSVLLTGISLLLMASLPYVSYNRTYVATVLYLCSALYGFQECPIQILSRSMSAKLVPAKVQGIAEATRFSVFQGAQIFSGLVLSFTSTHLSVCMIVVAAVNVVSMAILLAEHGFYIGRYQKLLPLELSTDSDDRDSRK